MILIFHLGDCMVNPLSRSLSKSFFRSKFWNLCLHLHMCKIYMCVCVRVVCLCVCTCVSICEQMNPCSGYAIDSRSSRGCWSLRFPTNSSVSVSKPLQLISALRSLSQHVGWRMAVWSLNCVRRISIMGHGKRYHGLVPIRTIHMYVCVYGIMCINICVYLHVYIYIYVCSAREHITIPQPSSMTQRPHARGARPLVVPAQQIFLGTCNRSSYNLKKIIIL